MIQSLFPNETDIGRIVSKINEIICKTTVMTIESQAPALSDPTGGKIDCVHRFVCFYVMHNYPINHLCGKSCKFYKGE